MLTIDELRFAYNGQAEPWTFSLAVNPGEIVAITGPSGSGKSTLLDLIAGFQIPLSGRVVLDGKEFTRQPPEQRPMSILFQSDNLFDHLTVADNVGLGLPKSARADERHQRIRDALAEMELDGYGTRRASKLSGGQKQRVALARTLLRDRPVLLLDEPFAALDAETAATIRQTVREMVRSHGWHTLIVSHLPEDAKGFADKKLRIEDWRLKLD
jgi:thiamine transport system ATP-binding protein